MNARNASDMAPRSTPAVAFSAWRTHRGGFARCDVLLGGEAVGEVWREDRRAPYRWIAGGGCLGPAVLTGWATTLAAAKRAVRAAYKVAPPQEVACEACGRAIPEDDAVREALPHRDANGDRDDLDLTVCPACAEDFAGAGAYREVAQAGRAQPFLTAKEQGMSRGDDLVRAAAEAFDDGRSIDHHFLVENAVTGDECVALGHKLSAILRGYLSAPAQFQNAIVIGGVMDDEDMVAVVWNQALLRQSGNRLREIGKALGG